MGAFFNHLGEHFCCRPISGRIASFDLANEVIGDGRDGNNDDKEKDCRRSVR